MTIKHFDNGKDGVFFIEKDGNRKAEMTYAYKDDHTIDIVHTEVKESLQGQGVGKKLFEEVVRFLRQKNFKAIATCSYAKSIFEKNPEEYQDIMS